MAEILETTHEAVSIRLSVEEVVGLSNVINHALHGGFCIEEVDCSSITGLEWNQLQGLWSVIRESRTVSGSS
jgi:hypothetical protein